MQAGSGRLGKARRAQMRRRVVGTQAPEGKAYFSGSNPGIRGGGELASVVSCWLPGGLHEHPASVSGVLLSGTETKGTGTKQPT